MADPLRWTDWIARRQPLRAGFAALVIAGAVAWAASFGWGYGLAAAVGLLGAVGPALLPLRYTLDDAGVRLDGALYQRQVPWTDVVRWVRAPDGFALVGRGRHAILRRRRGLVLRCPGHEHEVESWLSTRLPETSGAA